MEIATYNVNSIRRRLPIVLDWIAAHLPDVMCLQETKVQDHEFPVNAIREAGYHASFRGMKAYNGVATLTRTPPEKVIDGLHEGPDNEDFRIIQTVVSGAGAKSAIHRVSSSNSYRIENSDDARRGSPL